MMMPGLDHPQCIRFTSSEESRKLREKRIFSQTGMNAYLRLAEKQTDEGFPQFALFTNVISQSADSAFSHPDSTRIISGAFWGCCTIAYPEEAERQRRISQGTADFREMEQQSSLSPFHSSNQAR
jgi:hypothetical protein